MNHARPGHILQNPSRCGTRTGKPFYPRDRRWSLFTSWKSSCSSIGTSSASSPPAPFSRKSYYCSCRSCAPGRVTFPIPTCWCCWKPDRLPTLSRSTRCAAAMTERWPLRSRLADPQRKLLVFGLKLAAVYQRGVVLVKAHGPAATHEEEH